MSFAECLINQGYRENTPTMLAAFQRSYQIGVEAAERVYPYQSIAWLDIGPNNGHGLASLKPEKPNQVVAVDIKPEYLREAKKNNPSVRFATMDGRQLGFPDNRFDAVSLFQVIEHVEDPSRMLAEAIRVLKPGGVLILSTPNRVASGKRKMSPDHKQEYTTEEMHQMLERAGLEIDAEMGQAFFGSNFRSRLIKELREQPLVAYAYYRLLPWAIRRRFKESIQTATLGDEIRKPLDGEIARSLYFICRKPIVPQSA
jgi:ubiquinone/menaquinone biosynthesis C-methylase UbiE